MKAIRAIYRRWLDGSISQEEALFEIGDSIDAVAEPVETKEDVRTAPVDLLAV
jgi:hypothetical protein